MQDLKITLIQSPLHWQNADANLAMFEEKLWQIGEPTDLILLPEMFNTGFTMDVKKNAEAMNGKTYKWMKQQAEQFKAVVAGSCIIFEGGFFYNRLLWMNSDGTCQHYDKRHLFRMADEHKQFGFGTNKIVQNLKGWNICPLICYDLRFPVWSRNIEFEYDVLLYVANWPDARSHAWDTLLQARGLENLSYCIGLNRIGEDGNQIKYTGHSAVYGPKGETLLDLENKETIQTVILSHKKLEEYRSKFPAQLDADGFEII